MSTNWRIDEREVREELGQGTQTARSGQQLVL
jgi:hypothetical protein